MTEKKKEVLSNVMSVSGVVLSMSSSLTNQKAGSMHNWPITGLEIQMSESWKASQNELLGNGCHCVQNVLSPTLHYNLYTLFLVLYKYLTFYSFLLLLPTTLEVTSQAFGLALDRKKLNIHYELRIGIPLNFHKNRVIRI